LLFAFKMALGARAANNQKNYPDKNPFTFKLAK
jgi:hypothetical protein